MEPPLSRSPSRWRGRGTSRSGSVSVTTMHALFKGEVERKMMSGLDRIFSLRISEFEQPYRDAVLPCEQRLPKSLPQLSIRHTAAQTRISQPPRPKPNGIITVLQIDSSRTDSAVRVRYAQPRSPSLADLSRSCHIFAVGFAQEPSDRGKTSSGAPKTLVAGGVIAVRADKISGARSTPRSCSGARRGG